jgi:hypothetical protein
MRLIAKVVLGMGLAALISPAAMAQGGRGFGGGMGGGAALLANKSVAAELKLEPEQVEKATKFAEEQRAKMGELRSQFEGLSREEVQAKMQELQKKNGEVSAAFVKETLKPEQAKRFNQISLQQRGLQAFADAKVAKELKITDEQKTKLADITKELGAKRQEVMQDNQGDFAAIREKMVPITKEFTEKAHGVLTAEQKASYKELLGAPFEIKFEPRPQQ